jgi:hypothetical protein
MSGNQKLIEFKAYLFPTCKMVSSSQNSFFTLRVAIAKEPFRFTGICDDTELAAYNIYSPNFVMNRY